MATLIFADLIPELETVFNIMYVAIGIGLVIFFHELGHFAVAKWCNVSVERFSIGFGPILWAKKKGETEYALSIIPFGGYVKMLGQDDMDPSQLSSDEIAEDPRSYSAKPVWQRMAIISAGVIMNVITAVLFFAIAFQVGVESLPPLVGSVQPGMPAWEAGLQRGDRITQINGHESNAFDDIMIGVALTTQDVAIEGVHPDGTPFQATMQPDISKTRRMIGVGPTLGLELIDPEDKTISPVVDGTPAAKADPPFRHGDKIVKLDDKELSNFVELQNLLATNRRKSVEFLVEREGSTVPIAITVGPNHFRRLGLSLDIGTIAAIVKDSPAEAAGLKVGDKISKVKGQDVGKDLNPLLLPSFIADLHGENVAVEVVRAAEGGSKETLTVNLVPVDRPGWLERPSQRNVPISVPSIGVAFHLNSVVLKVEPDSPAAEAKIPVGSRVKKMEFILPEGAEPDLNEDANLVFEFGDKEKNWGAAFWTLQVVPKRIAKLTIDDPDGKEQVFELTPQRAENWFAPTRGIRLVRLSETRKADSFASAMTMGVTRSKATMIQIYLTLRNLVGGFLSPKELHGPIGIATVAYKLAQQGISALLLFLGLLSINLAVLNFLPIPVLDGGHMVFLFWEAITRKKPSERVLAAATYCGMAFVLGLMLFVIYLDIFVHWNAFG